MRKLRNSELNRLSTENFKASKKTSIIVMLDDIRSSHNVGSVFRTSDAFRIKEVVLGGITPRPPLAEIEKTALGATESVSWRHEASLVDYIAELKKTGYRVIGFEQTDQSVSLAFKAIRDQKVALIFGNEVKGISDEVLRYCDDLVEIPQFGTKHSLNISVSVGIAIWEFAKVKIKKGEL